ncbi:MAG: NPCBM/NEW2 domain-containing protein, partial [Bacteroidota bacterium]|nr:NPCBM/NEW2 domain-containing protein [Bacteroidota bacterium]
MRRIINYVVFFSIVFLSFTGHENDIWLDQLNISLMKSGWGSPRINKSITGTALSIAGTRFERGVGTHALSTFLIKLDGHAKYFIARVGVDDDVCDKASVIFYVLGDKKILWKSEVMKKGEKARDIKVNLSGIKKLGLLVTEADDGGNCDHADWANAHLIYSGEKPVAINNEPGADKGEILTPAAPLMPRINGPKIYGVHPGSPFLYRIPATGERPMSFDAENLPEGLKINPSTGIISGQIGKAGSYSIVLIAKNGKGQARKDFLIRVGETLALTPSMGWNSWYIYYGNVSDSLIRLSADQLVNSGMVNYGYQFVNVDDCWAVKADSNDPIVGGITRDETGGIRTNKKFPDMPAMTGYIHSKGLKAGIYTSPGPMTCAHYEGSYKHEKQDAETFANWGFDFLKYDWCTYGRVEPSKTVEDMQAPYKLMWNEVRKLKRDVVFNLCQYGMG